MTVGTTKQFHFGETLNRNGDETHCIGFYGNSKTPRPSQNLLEPMEVGLFPPNQWGLYMICTVMSGKGVGTGMAHVRKVKTQREHHLVRITFGGVKASLVKPKIVDLRLMVTTKISQQMTWAFALFLESRNNNMNISIKDARVIKRNDRSMTAAALIHSLHDCRGSEPFLQHTRMICMLRILASFSSCPAMCPTPMAQWCAGP